jgi:hypothetical protein
MVGYRQGEDWCMSAPEPVDVYIKVLRMNKVPFHRCPKCKRRLQLKIIKNEQGEAVTMFPAHKLRKTKRK